MTDSEDAPDAVDDAAGDVIDDTARDEVDDVELDVIENNACDVGEGDSRDVTGDSRGDRSEADPGQQARRRVVLGYALLFSLPVGIGVAVMVLQETDGRLTDAVVIGPSFVLFAAVFLLVVAIASSGSPES
ncbi:hypothetical protein [Halobellus sp. GM3]|uniref:hypothetical protein n=1 Tax=Halobellus sp. GM3 TaxID=3458410 RepID=UPI00403DF715